MRGEAERGRSTRGQTPALRWVWLLTLVRSIRRSRTKSTSNARRAGSLTAPLPPVRSARSPRLVRLRALHVRLGAPTSNPGTGAARRASERRIAGPDRPDQHPAASFSGRGWLTESSPSPVR